MKIAKILLGIALVVIGSHLHAQTPSASPTPPAPPLIKRAPDGTQWAITYQLADSSSISSGGPGRPDAAPPKEASVIKSRGVIVERTVDSNGNKGEKWCFPSGLVASLIGNTWIAGGSNGQGFDSVDYSREDFAGFDWISAQNFVGPATVKARKCLVFKDRIVTAELSDLQAIKSSAERTFKWTAGANGEEAHAESPQFNLDDYKSDVMAYIDDETRLPIALVYKGPKGTITRVYQFQPFSGTLTVPPEVLKAAGAFQSEQSRLTGGRPPI